jgi:hypothetical protein
MDCFDLWLGCLLGWCQLFLWTKVKSSSKRFLNSLQGTASRDAFIFTLSLSYFNALCISNLKSVIHTTIFRFPCADESAPLRHSTEREVSALPSSHSYYVFFNGTSIGTPVPLPHNPPGTLLQVSTYADLPPKSPLSPAHLPYTMPALHYQPEATSLYKLRLS